MMIIRSASRAGEEVCLANPEGMQTETNNSKLVKKIIVRAGLVLVNESRRIGSPPNSTDCNDDTTSSSGAEVIQASID